MKNLRTGSNAAKSSNLEENSSNSLSVISKYDVAIKFSLFKFKLSTVYFIFGKCDNDFFDRWDFNYKLAFGCIYCTNHVSDMLIFPLYSVAFPTPDLDYGSMKNDAFQNKSCKT